MDRPKCSCLVGDEDGFNDLLGTGNLGDMAPLDNTVLSNGAWLLQRDVLGDRGDVQPFDCLLKEQIIPLARCSQDCARSSATRTRSSARFSTTAKRFSAARTRSLARLSATSTSLSF
mmetsp:Transcript_24987/g.78764  ORF Transcript_24987/g.78764 Transcript_24987/m.78764 type:complete len:117 (+) Transcript_24987:248-598(+)